MSRNCRSPLPIYLYTYTPISLYTCLYITTAAPIYSTSYAMEGKLREDGMERAAARGGTAAADVVHVVEPGALAGLGWAPRRPRELQRLLSCAAGVSRAPTVRRQTRGEDTSRQGTIAIFPLLAGLCRPQRGFLIFVVLCLIPYPLFRDWTTLPGPILLPPGTGCALPSVTSAGHGV